MAWLSTNDACPQENVIFRDNSFSSLPGVITTHGNGVQDVKVRNSIFRNNNYLSNNVFVSCLAPIVLLMSS